MLFDKASPCCYDNINMKKSIDRPLLGLIIVFFLAFGLFITLTTFNRQLATLTRAKEESIPSSETSLIFAWPLTSSTASTAPVEINVFIRNATNLPISGRLVTLTTTRGSFSYNSQTTDKSGKSTFYLTSSAPGIAEVTGMVDNQIQLKQKVTIKFE